MALGEVVDEAHKTNKQVIIGGDFNAEVGARQEYDDANCVGCEGSKVRNRRGSWLLQWATINKLSIFFSSKFTRPLN